MPRPGKKNIEVDKEVWKLLMNIKNNNDKYRNLAEVVKDLLDKYEDQDDG